MKSARFFRIDSSKLETSDQRRFHHAKFQFNTRLLVLRLFEDYVGQDCAI